MKNLLLLLFIISILFSCSKNSEIEEIEATNCNCPTQELGITNVYQNSYYPQIYDENIEFHNWSKQVNGNILTVVKSSHSLISQCGTESYVNYNFKIEGKCLLPLNRTTFFDGEMVPNYVFPDDPISELIIQEYIPNQKLVCRVITNLGINLSGTAIYETDNIWVNLN